MKGMLFSRTDGGASSGGVWFGFCYERIESVDVEVGVDEFADCDICLYGVDFGESALAITLSGKIGRSFSHKMETHYSEEEFRTDCANQNSVRYYDGADGRFAVCGRTAGSILL